MELIKRKILLEDFINREGSKFLAVDGTNEGKNEDEREYIWGKIAQDVIIDGEYSDLIKIALHLDYLGDDYDPSSLENVVEWDNEYYLIENIGKIYKETIQNGYDTIEKYYKLSYVDVLSFVEYENDDDKSLTHVIKHKTLFKYYRFLKNLRTNIKLYHKCNGRFFEIVDDNVYDNFYEHFFTSENGGIVISSSDNIYIPCLTGGEDGFCESLVDCNELEYAIPFSEFGFYGEVPTDVDNIEHDVICVTKKEYADTFNTVFRQNDIHRYECILWNLSEDVKRGKSEIYGIDTYMDIPVYIDSDINSMGLYNIMERGENTSEESPNNDIERVVIEGQKYSELRKVFQRRLSESEEGEILPFVIKENVEEKDGSTTISLSSELPYVLGYGVINDGMTNILEEIVVTDIDENGNEITNKWQYILSEKRIYKNDIPVQTNIITCDELTKKVNNETVGMKGTIKFKYRLNAVVESSNGIVTKINEDTGIIHEETYNFETHINKPIYFIPSTEEKIKDGRPIVKFDIPNDSVKIGVIEVEYEESEDESISEYYETLHNSLKNIGRIFKKTNDDDTFSYVQVVLFMNYTDIDYDHNSDENIEDVPMVNINYYANILDDVFEDNFIYKPNYLHDIEDISEKIIDGDLVGHIYIERSKSAAFERHNILSEVNTMQDLENYRNDFFKIRN